MTDQQKETYTVSKICPNCFKYVTLEIPKGERVEATGRECGYCGCDIVKKPRLDKLHRNAWMDYEKEYDYNNKDLVEAKIEQIIKKIVGEELRLEGQEMILDTKQCAEVAKYMYEEWQKAMEPPLYSYYDFPKWLNEVIKENK